MARRRSSVRLLALLAVLGCAHAAMEPPASSASAQAPARATAAGGSAPAGTPAAPDPSEEITAAELASIPDPVPAAPAAFARAHDDSTLASADSVATSATPPPTKGGATAGGAPGAANGVVWRVQIFATPDLAQAGRVAREAQAKLGVPAVVEYEGTLYKVRLGSYESEAAAQSLRDRAIGEGYTGAFRMQAKEAGTKP